MIVNPLLSRSGAPKNSLMHQLPHYCQESFLHPTSGSTLFHHLEVYLQTNQWHRRHFPLKIWGWHTKNTKKHQLLQNVHFHQATYWMQTTASVKLDTAHVNVAVADKDWSVPCNMAAAKDSTVQRHIARIGSQILKQGYNISHRKHAILP